MAGKLVDQYFFAGYDMLNKKLVGECHTQRATPRHTVSWELTHHTLADITLQEYGYHVFNDENYLDEAACTANYGARWMEYAGKGRCMRLVYQDGGNNVYWPAPESVIKAAEDKYNIDITEYYSASCDCAISGSGEPDTNALPSDGSLPQCFYNIDCQDAEVCRKSHLHPFCRCG